MLNKRGVVTTFIIAGILIVSLVVGVYFTKDYILKSEWQRLREQPVPGQARDIKDFVESCIKSVGDEAASLVGMQGGFAEVPGDPIELSRVNLFSNGVVVGGSLKVPYWLYEQSNGITKEQMPSKEKIEKEISKYINNNLRNCLGEFKTFENYKINEGIIKTETEIQDDKILFSVDYPLHIELKDFKFDFVSFYEKVDVPLGKLYGIAKKIYYKEKNIMFLEEHTIDWMGQYSNQIPTSGVKETCVPPFWIKEKVISDFKNILFNNIQFLKIKGSNYVLIDEANERFLLDVYGKDIDCNFMFSKSWPFELEVVPEKNGLLKSQSLTEGLGIARGIAESFVCLSTWHFIYNIKYPVLVTLSEGDYMFQFALHVVIDKNEPRKSEIVTESFEDIDKKVCENRRNEISVYTIDDNGNVLEDVDISYKCITHTCDIGTTKLDEYGEASFTDKFPLCINGAMLGSKEGYHTAREIVSTTESGTLTLELEPYRKLGVDVVIQRAGSGMVKENEDVFISMEEIDKGYGVFVTYPDQKEINLIPGNYKVRVFLMSEFPEGISIPARTIKTCVKVMKEGVAGYFGGKEEKCVDVKVPGMELDQAITGNVEFDLSVSKYDLSNKKIIFYLPYEKPTNFEEYTKILTPSKEFIRPKFKNV